MRMLRNRLLASIVAVTLLCAMGTTAQAGVVPWLWNFVFGPANAPLFPRRGYAARPFRARRFAAPYVAGYAYAPPAVSWAPNVSYAPTDCCTTGYAPTYTTASYGCGTCTDGCTTSYSPVWPTVSYGSVVNYGPGVSSACCGVTSFEYSSSVSNCCGTTTYDGAISGGTIVGGSTTSGSTTGGYEGSTSGETRRDDPIDVTDPPATDDDRPAPGTGMGDDDFFPPRTGGSGAPVDPVEPGGFDDLDLDALGGANRPVIDENDPPPSSEAGTDAKRIRTVPVTVSLKAQLGRDTQLRRTVGRTQISASKRTFRWISVPSDGRITRM